MCLVYLAPRCSGEALFMPFCPNWAIYGVEYIINNVSRVQCTLWHGDSNHLQRGGWRRARSKRRRSFEPLVVMNRRKWCRYIAYLGVLLFVSGVPTIAHSTFGWFDAAQLVPFCRNELFSVYYLLPVLTKTYTLRYFYEHYLVLFTSVPRHSV